MLCKKCTLKSGLGLTTKKEIDMSDYIEDLLDVGFDDYEDDCDDAVEM